MKTKTKLFMTLSIICLVLFGIIFLTTISTKDLTLIEPKIYMLISCMLAVACLLFAWKARSMENKQLKKRAEAETERWNNMSFPEKCEKMAEGLYFGKRFWYLGIGVGNKHMALPLNPKNMDEMGGGFKSKSDPAQIARFLKQDKISNTEVAEAVLAKLNEIETKVARGILKEIS